MCSDLPGPTLVLGGTTPEMDRKEALATELTLEPQSQKVGNFQPEPNGLALGQNKTKQNSISIAVKQDPESFK